jgi:hypothetical protein
MPVVYSFELDAQGVFTVKKREQDPIPDSINGV